jgi:N-acetylmuramoyl-L-alanine amidase
MSLVDGGRFYMFSKNSIRHNRPKLYQAKQGPFVWIHLKWIKWSGMFLVFLSAVCLLMLYNPSVSTVWNYWSLPLSGVTVALDAGHGGPDGGAVSKEGIIEKDINLAVSLYLRDYLQQAGAIVVMTREDDRDLANPETKGYKRRKTEDLHYRARFIEEKQADLFVSIHMNSIPSSRWNGAQTFYGVKNNDSMKLANFVQKMLVHQLENTNRVAKTSDKTVYLLDTLNIPAILVEVGFLSNPKEALQLGNPDYQRKVAASIYEGILKFKAEKQADRSAD